MISTSVPGPFRSSGLILFLAFLCLKPGFLVARCTGGFDQSALTTSRAAALQALSRAEHERVEAVVEEALGQLPCAVEVLEAKTFAELFLYLGISRARSEELEAARTAYQNALALLPALAWDEDFGPELREPFDAVRAELETTDRVGLLVRGDRKSTFFVDGVRVVPGQPQPLPRGLHYLQALRGSRVQGTLLVSTMTGKELVLEYGDVKRRRAVSVDRSTRVTTMASAAALAVVAGTIAALSYRDAVNTYDQWAQGGYTSEVVTRNHRGLIVAWSGLSVGLLGVGTGLGMTLFTRPTVTTTRTFQDEKTIQACNMSSPWLPHPDVSCD